MSSVIKKTVVGREWTLLDKFLEIRSPWFDLIGEHFRDETGVILDYWRVEKPDSIIILPIWNNHFLLPRPIFRPGLNRCTVDFPGGRAPSNNNFQNAVPEILRRELGLDSADIQRIDAIDRRGWAIDSSFSNHHLHGFVADISPSWEYDPSRELIIHPCDLDSVLSLLNALNCLQCRALLLEWLVRKRLS